MKILNKNSVELSARQRELLSRYFDNELSWPRRIFAQRLLRNSDVAANYIESLAALRVNVAEMMQPTAASGERAVDLWSKINARIDIEERSTELSAVYLKQKTVKAKTGKKTGEKSGSFADQYLGYGYGFGAGVASAALVLLTVLPQGGNTGSTNKDSPAGSVSAGSGFNNANNNATGDSQATGPVRYSAFDIQGTDFDSSASFRNLNGANSNSGLHSVSNGGATARQRVTPVEIDWVRSDGRLQVMRDAAESNPVIFIAPRSSSSGSGRIVNPDKYKAIQNYAGLPSPARSRRYSRLNAGKNLENLENSAVQVQTSSGRLTAGQSFGADNITRMRLAPFDDSFSSPIEARR